MTCRWGLNAGEDFTLDRCESIRQTKNSLSGIEEFFCGTGNLNERGQSNCGALRPFFFARLYGCR